MTPYKMIFISILCFFIPISQADIFKWKDAEGNIQFSDKKPTHKPSEDIHLKINTYKSITIDPNLIKDTHKTNSMKNVIIYSTAWCGYCKKAKKYFRKNNIPYTEYDIDKDKAAKKRYKEMGATSVPVIFIGETRINGFSASSFEKIYNN